MKLPPLTPFLAVTFFVLVNHRELQPFVKWEELVGVLVMALALTGAVLWLTGLVVKDARKAGLLAALGVVFFCFYADFDHGLKRLAGGCGWPGLAHTRYLAPLITALFAAAAWLILRARQPLVRFKSVLRVFIGGMIGATVFLLQLYPSQFVSRRDRPREVDEHGPFPGTNSRPDIYFIVLDAYTGAGNLKKFWDYDNTPFTSFLESNGFFVVSGARANYDQTPRCLASALNMAHIRRPPPDLSEWGRVNRMCELIDLAAAPRKLREIGYEIVNLSLFDVAGQPQYYRFPPVDSLSLSELLYFKSVAGYVDGWFRRQRLGRLHLEIFSRLRNLAAEPHPPRPRFIYAHVLTPHYPYVFDENGLRSGPVALRGSHEEYLQQLKYVNRLVTNTIGSILSHSRTPPIILLQGDHGYRYLPEPDQRESAASILNAYHLPGGRRDWVQEGITPVNSFRMVFNRYFGAHYERVPDRFYHRMDLLPENP